MSHMQKEHRYNLFKIVVLFCFCILIFLYVSLQKGKPEFYLQCKVAIIAFYVLLLLVIVFKIWKHKRCLASDMMRIDCMTGIEFENYLGEKFQSFGYDVSVTPASNDYGADLIIQKDGRRIAVQAKRWESKINNTAVQEVTAAIKYYQCDGGMIVSNSELTANAMELAKVNNIIVWERDCLQKYFVENDWDGELEEAVTYRVWEPEIARTIQVTGVGRISVKADKEELYAKAIADARSKAEALTTAAGVSLGEIVSIVYSGEDMVLSSGQFDETIVQGSETPETIATGYEPVTESDEMEVTDKVTVVWSIRGGGNKE